MSILRTRQRMGLAAAIMGASILLSRVMGLVRDKIISYFHGAGLESDIYFASFVIPDFINYLLAGGYFSITLIPLLATAFDRSAEDGWRFFWSVLNWVGVAIVAVTLLAMLLAPELARIAAPGFDAASLERLTLFLRIILPAQVFFLLGSCITALLFLRKQFLVPALIPLVYNGCIIAGGLLLGSRGMEGFCWGVLVGAILGSFALPLLAARTGEQGTLRYRPILWHADLKRFILLALPLMLGQSVVVLDEQLLRVFGSLTVEGAVSWLNYSRRVMLVPVGVVAQAAGVASYPFLAQLAARAEKQRFDATLSQALNTATAVVLPLSLWMAVAAEPTIRLIFEQGRFSEAATQQTALCLQVMLLAVFCWGVQQIVGRAFYAHKDTLRPALCGTAVSIAFVPLYYLLALRLGAVGIAVASALSVAAYTLVLCLLWRRRFGSDGFAGLGRTILAAGALCVPACVVAWIGVRHAPMLTPQRPLLGATLALTGSAVLFGLVYIPLGRKLAPRAVAPLFSAVERVRDRLARSGRRQEPERPS